MTDPARDHHREWREAMFRMRYAMEQLAAAITAFNTAYRQAVDNEIAGRRASARAAAARRLRDQDLVEAEYQEWKRQLAIGGSTR